MDINWAPCPKPKSGHEEEFQVLLSELRTCVEYRHRKRVLTRMTEISIFPYQSVTIPRVGIDEIATNNLKERILKRHPYTPEHKLQEELQRAYGQELYYLTQEKDALPKYSKPDAGFFDFNGGVLTTIPEIPLQLLVESKHNHSAAQSLEYADKLETFLKEYTIKYGDPEPCDILQAAVTWLRFWGNNGHGFELW
jgi:hypothetical protein